MEECVGKSIWHSGNIPKASGVVILIKKTLEIEIVQTQKDKDGQILNCIIKFATDKYICTNKTRPKKTFLIKTYKTS